MNLRAVAVVATAITVERAADALARAGRTGIEINAPGTTSSAVVGAPGEAGATQVEPGRRLGGLRKLWGRAEIS